MKSRLQRIEIRNFKAFRELVFDVEGRHLLVFGLNGSGKSSLYWALHTFLQSARKPTLSVLGIIFNGLLLLSVGFLLLIGVLFG